MVVGMFLGFGFWVLGFGFLWFRVKARPKKPPILPILPRKLNLPYHKYPPILTIFHRLSSHYGSPNINKLVNYPTLPILTILLKAPRLTS